MVEELGTLLSVCHANICRSPLIEHLLRRELAGAGIDGGIRVESAGTHAIVGAELCAVCARAIEDDDFPAASDGGDTHRARQLDVEMLDRADLVIVASGAERAAAARISPASRDRTFTLLEAAALAEVMAERDGDHALAPGATRSALRSLAEGLAAQRGLATPVAAPQPPRGRWARLFSRETEPPATFDLDDVHMLGVDGHQPMIETARGAVARFADFALTR
ncbi:hypothetical protein MN032_00565 [Agromyces atrinae]|uniref:arsenate reductase/protein-tyrosine-phosphatase family protein n=1 Tax=Agromyces atrinae TaxID=592376 RepID=UPI001F596315|nr:hypothetical protein [Agromyces atrinae]MCI2956167.1 hypothetical protein [Agromyces atrinae]